MTHPSITAVVVAAQGGVRLERTLADAAWAGACLVLDPLARVPDGSLPAGVRRVATLDLLAVDTAWFVLLLEGESVDPELARAVVAVPAAGTQAVAYRVAHTVEGLAARWRPRAAPVRVARRGGAQLALGHDGRIALRTWGRAARLPGSVLVHAAPSLAIAVDEMVADGAVAAVVLATHTERTGLVRSSRAALVAGAQALVARRLGRAREPWPAERWCLAWLAAYRALLVHAQLWERTECLVPWSP